MTTHDTHMPHAKIGLEGSHLSKLTARDASHVCMHDLWIIFVVAVRLVPKNPAFALRVHVKVRKWKFKVENAFPGLCG